MTEHVIKPLTLETWDAYARLIEKHNGVWGGCWCTWFHDDTPDMPKKDSTGYDWKHRMVELGIAHAALVFDGDDVVGWAEYGSPAELPRIYHRKEYLAVVPEPSPYRITCFFVDRNHRRSGVSREALRGALELIAANGGGSVEGYPNDVPEGKKISASFLFSSTRALFEEAGFVYIRPLGTSRCVMRRTVAAANAAA
jgi:GNAT superfamily N-acetyltransferase